MSTFLLFFMSQYNNVSKDKYVLYKNVIACVTGNFYFTNNNIYY